MQFVININKNLGRILAFDYGRKRTGLAASDPLKMIANGLETVSSDRIWDFLSDYTSREEVEVFVVGYPLQMDRTPSESMPLVRAFVKKLKKTYPDIRIETMDERFSSSLAKQAMIDGGLKQKARRDKALVDRISATIILQSYLDMISPK